MYSNPRVVFHIQMICQHIAGFDVHTFCTTSMILLVFPLRWKHFKVHRDFDYSRKSNQSWHVWLCFQSTCVIMVPSQNKSVLSKIFCCVGFFHCYIFKSVLRSGFYIQRGCLPELNFSLPSLSSNEILHKNWNMIKLAAAASVWKPKLPRSHHSL
jgi:hypothetical protein